MCFFNESGEIIVNDSIIFLDMIRFLHSRLLYLLASCFTTWYFLRALRRTGAATALLFVGVGLYGRSPVKEASTTPNSRDKLLKITITIRCTLRSKVLVGGKV